MKIFKWLTYIIRIEDERLTQKMTKRKWDGQEQSREKEYTQCRL